ncbi:lactonase family protein [Pedobacter insulae]|uniref:6-phosphogluconolactonase n=1 Tax=Pedobacter insulae TaxID=414048 RepID=A0A1I2ZSW5_9SPHI|nr:lactonase family protein [Pedobacter insulae]SFH40705.1 6-phosphogluconolactonase [Pedobacter insulae]
MQKNVLLLFSIFLLANHAKAQKYNLLIGTYTNKGTSEGIYVYDFNSSNADTKLKSIAKNVVNPSYLALSSDNKFLYSVNENGKESGVSAFSFDSKSGTLEFLDRKSPEGADPCYIITNGKKVLTANYSGGSITALSTGKDGKFLDTKQVIQHTGKSIDPKRQLSSHVHQIQLTPDKKYIVTDLGEDQIYVYATETNHPGTLIRKSVTKTNPGSGPRHLTFSPNGKFAYLTHEFNGKITAYRYSNANLQKIQEIETTPKDFSGKIDAADIHVSEDGKFLYQSNRGEANTLSVFKIQSGGTLKLVEIVSTLGKGPRNFSIDPSGDFLLVAHQYTNDVVIFNRDKTTGKLTDSGKRIQVGAPVCLIFSKI